MAVTYTPIATNTLGSAASSVTFSSISGTYTDLIIVINGLQNTGGADAFEFNGDTGSNYSYTLLYGDGTVAGSSRGSNLTSVDFGVFYLGTTQSVATINVQNYSNTTTYKTVISRSSGGGFVSARTGLWRSTAAITSIKISCGANTFSSGTMFTLYGIKAA